jgi:hypothetical protein
MSASKQRGTAAETAVVRYLQANGHPDAERRTLAGRNDRGDIANIPGVAVEVKACKAIDLAGWVDEANVEAKNAGVPVGVVWAKRRGKTDPASWYVVMDGATFLKLIDEAS